MTSKLQNSFKKIKRMQKKIDHIDREIVGLIIKRILMVDKIWKLKASISQPSYNRTRENEILDRYHRKLIKHTSSPKITKLVTAILNTYKKY